MTKNVLISISGLHTDLAEYAGDNVEPIEVITPASYYYKDGKHYVLYDEVVEGMRGTIRNTVKVTGDACMEIIKSGLSSTHMVFEKDKMTITQYDTPYGQLLIGIHTKNIKVVEEERNIEILINYELDINSERVADCNIRMNIKALDNS